MHSRSSSFYNGRTKIFKQRQPASHAGDPWARQIANGNGDLALTDALLHCHGRTSPALCTLSYWNSPVWLAVPYAFCISPVLMAISGLHALIASNIRDLLTDTKLAIGNGGLGPAWHAFHVKNCPLPEIITKEPHLGKYFLKEP